MFDYLANLLAVVDVRFPSVVDSARFGIWQVQNMLMRIKNMMR